MGYKKHFTTVIITLLIGSTLDIVANWAIVNFMYTVTCIVYVYVFVSFTESIIYSTISQLLSIGHN